LLSMSVPNETFAQLVSLGKKITDYGDDAAEAKGEGEDGEGEGAIDDDVGVAVVFEEEDEEDDEEEQFEMRDSDDSDDEDEEEDERIAGAAGGRDGNDDPMVTGANEGSDAEGQDDDGDAVMLGSKTASTTKTTTSDGTVPAREIDGFWLQRLFASSYPDPIEAAQKTEAAMSLLEGDSNVRDVENALMELTEYDKFEVVEKLVKNREKVVWCTRLARADEDGKVDVEVAMREKGCGWILKELRGDVGKKDASGSTIKPVASADSKKGTLVPGSLAPAPRKTVDLESMAFQQGARLMSNKKVKLPEGSFKRSKKGYEEVHVPAPKPAPLKEGELVPVTDLPEWAREAFKGNPTLNRVQSRLYPVAFGTDEPLLLCAPTGAGKVRTSSFSVHVDAVLTRLSSSSSSSSCFLSFLLVSLLVPSLPPSSSFPRLPRRSQPARRPTSPCLRSSTSSRSTATRPPASSTSPPSRLSTSLP
jgi:pre-mRNA-splicing helicase BRR2